MTRSSLVCIVALSATLYSQERVAAQVPAWPKADSLSADIVVDTASFEYRSLVLTLGFTVRNSASSTQPAHIVEIEARAPVMQLWSPDGLWVHVGPQRDDSVAFWGAGPRRNDVAPGTSRSGFAVRARGLPGIVRFWVQGRYDVPNLSEADMEALGPEPRVEENSVTGLTVGAEAVADLTLASLLQRLSGLNARACQLEWVTSAGVCHGLQGKLEQATASLARGNRQAARGQLQAFVQELSAQRGPEPGKHVSENAYWLLRLNVEFLLGKL